MPIWPCAPILLRLPAVEAERERSIRAALTDPGSVAEMPPGKRPPLPVPLWLHPKPTVSGWQRETRRPGAATVPRGAAGRGPRRHPDCCRTGPQGLRGSRLRFDLDLPAEAEDDLVLDEGILLPEWDWQYRRLQANHCRIVEMLAAEAAPCPFSARLVRTAKHLRN